MDRRASLLRDSLRELHKPTPPSCDSATHLARRAPPPPLRIVVPPSEYCPFSTDLTLPITPLSLPTPVSSSCFTFSDTQELACQSASAQPTPAPVLSSCSRDTTAADFASPTSSQFLLMPPTPHSEDVDVEMAIRVSPLLTDSATDVLMRSGSNGTKSRNPRPWEVSSSTWLTDLGGYTETDRIFRRNLLDVTSFDTDSSPASTPALSPSAVSPSSSPASLLPALSPCTYAMYPQSSSPARLALKPMGTDTFPSALDSLQAWRESVTPGNPVSVEPRSPLSEDAHDSRVGELVPEIPNIRPSLPCHPLHSHHHSLGVSRVSKSQTLIKHAKMFSGRVRRLVRRQSMNRHRGSMDRGVSFRVVTSQDSENGSVILITAPPPPYDVHPQARDPTEQEYARSRTTSEYSSAVQASTVELATSGTTELVPRQGSNRNALRRLSLMALSTMKRL